MAGWNKGSKDITY